MKLSPRNRVLLLAAVAVLGIVALVALLIVPLVSRLATVRVEVETALDDAQSARTLLEQRQQVKNKAAITDATLIQLGVAVPETPDLPSLIIELQDTAFDAGVVIMSVQPGGAERAQNGAYYTIPFTLDVWGTWSDTVDFLQRLERTERQLRTTSFDVTVLPVTEEDENEAGLSFPPYYQVRNTVKVDAFVIPAVQTTPSAPPATAPAPQQ